MLEWERKCECVVVSPTVSPINSQPSTTLNHKSEKTQRNSQPSSLSPKSSILCKRPCSGLGLGCVELGHSDVRNPGFGV